jgi:hypothetical protein
MFTGETGEHKVYKSHCTSYLAKRKTRTVECDEYITHRPLLYRLVQYALITKEDHLCTTT